MKTDSQSTSERGAAERGRNDRAKRGNGAERPSEARTEKLRSEVTSKVGRLTSKTKDCPSLINPSNKVAMNVLAVAYCDECENTLSPEKVGDAFCGTCPRAKRHLSICDSCYALGVAATADDPTLWYCSKHR